MNYLRSTIVISTICMLILGSACKQQPADSNEIEQKNETLLGNLLITPSTQHKKVSAETEEVDFTYTAFNQGVDPVEIVRLDAGCACIEESIEPRIIQPGQSAKIVATYATGKVNGLAEKTLQVKTNQAGLKGAFLKIKLEVDPIYTFKNEQLSWKIGADKKTQVAEFIVKRDKPIRLLSATSSRPEIVTEVKEVEEGKHYKIEVTPTTTDANMLGFIRLVTDCEVEAHSRPLLYVTVSNSEI